VSAGGEGAPPGAFLRAEIAAQPACWRRAAALAAAATDRLPADGERVAVVGCGTSWFMAQAYAGLREAAGRGETDAFTASEVPAGRRYDRVLAITRSGTTSEVLTLLHRVRGGQPTLALTAAPGSPVLDAADQAIVLDFADERSVVQTRFATSALALLRAGLGEDLAAVVAQAEQAVAADPPGGLLDRARFAFLGAGWAVGLANEAALKLREACLAWSESYPAMEYRHGPISVADERSAVWFLSDPPAGLPEEVAATGALVVGPGGDPMAELVAVQRLAAALAAARGLDPDRPRHLRRSVILPARPG
jgi:fructoselysine-6-P-deglycase FrlB-like protein